MKRILIAFGLSLAGLVASAGGRSLPLGGSWEFRFEEGKALEEVSDPAFAATETIAVPACYDTLPKYLFRRGTGLYRRTFILDAPVDNAWLVVDGMGLRGAFWMDGRRLGVYPFPYARLEIPTGPLAAGEHTVFAALDNRLDAETLKLARADYDFYCYGGFYHGVSLSFDNRKLRIRTRDYRTGEIEVEVVNEVKVKGEGGGEGGGEGEGEGEGEGGQRTLVFDGKNEVEVTFKDGKALVKVPDFRLWSPEHPNLHTVELISRASPLKARFGIRTVEARDRKLWLNGRELYLKGANRHESHPTFGAATPESLMAVDIQNLKSLGGNFFRGAHYQQSQRFLDLCDENGILVWEESLGWGNRTNELADAGFRRLQVEQTREMVRTSFNHPSVIFFAFLNEFASQTAEGRALAERLVKAVRDEDSGRLVTWANNRRLADDVCSDLVDVIAINTYPGWIGEWTSPGGRAALARNVKAGDTGIDTVVARHRAKGRRQPIIVSEMGTCGIYGHHDPACAQWTEEFQAAYVGCVLDAVLSNPEICGISLWQYADAKSFHFTDLGGSILRCKPLGENLAGLYDGYRRPKAVVEVVKRAFEARKGKD